MTTSSPGALKVLETPIKTKPEEVKPPPKVETPKPLAPSAEDKVLTVTKIKGAKWNVRFQGPFSRKDINMLWRLIFRQFRRDTLRRRLTKLVDDRKSQMKEQTSVEPQQPAAQ